MIMVISWMCGLPEDYYVWMPVGPAGPAGQYHTRTITAHSGLRPTSGGKIYTVEKHGLTSPVWISPGRRPINVEGITNHITPRDYLFSLNSP